MNEQTTHHSFGSRIRKLDVFKKVSTDFSTGTNVGGFISILTILTIMFFTYFEVVNYLNPQYESSLNHNNLFSKEEMMISLDIEFPRFPCELISLDLQDSMLSHHPNIASVKKYRLDSNGDFVDSFDFEIFRQNNPFEQMEMVKNALLKKYGCRLIGQFTVKEVPGNFHISSHAYEPNYVRAKNAGMMKGIDVSHKIHTLHFGSADITRIYKQHPEAELMRLDDHHRIYPPNQDVFYVSHYHLNIVPTTYTHLLGDQKTYQYTWNHNSYPTSSMPSLYFVYQVQGISVHVRPWQSGFFQFLIYLSIIIGGVYAIGMFVDKIAYTTCCRPTGYQLIK